MSIGWALCVWVFGESMGGILAPGASWLFGAPGAVIFYALAGALLALPERAWRDPRLGRRLLVGCGVYFIAMAVLQAWPGNGFWTEGSSGALPAMVSEMAETPQPHAIAQVLGHFGSFAAGHAVLVNAFVVAALGGIGLALLSGRRRAARVGGGGGARGEPRGLGAGAGLRGVRRRRHRPQQHDPHAARAVRLLPGAGAARASPPRPRRAPRAARPRQSGPPWACDPRSGCSRWSRRAPPPRWAPCRTRSPPSSPTRRRCWRKASTAPPQRCPGTCGLPTCRWSNSTAGPSPSPSSKGRCCW